jgi:hypothetical protein
MNKEQIAAIHQLFADQLNTRGKIFLNDETVLQTLIERTNDGSLYVWLYETGIRFKDVCKEHRLKIPASYFCFDGQKFSFMFYLCNERDEWITLEYNIRHAITLDNFLEEFAYVYGQTVNKLIGRIAQFAIEESEV